MTKLFYCPACGKLCDQQVDRYAADSVEASCSKGHRWAALVNFDAPSDDGTAVVMHCVNTPAHELPDAVS